jgi:hypothetical protein
MSERRKPTVQHPLRTRLVRSLSRLAVGGGLLALATLVGCGGSAKTAQITLFPEYVLTDPAGKTQAKSAVTITVSPLSKAGMYDHPELFAFDRSQVAKEIADGINFETYYEKDYSGKYWCYPFGVAADQLAVFSVEVTNGTDHILRMQDARIYLEVEGHDPIAAVVKLGDPTLVPRPGTAPITPLVPQSALAGDESLVHWVTYFEEDAERKRKKDTFFDSQKKVPIGLASQVIGLNRSAYKLVADVGAEILPGKTLKGILLFPVIISFDTATVSFYDIHTKTDAAGNPTEKSTFTFPVKLSRVQMTWDGEKEKRWKRAGAGS